MPRKKKSSGSKAKKKIVIEEIKGCRQSEHLFRLFCTGGYQELVDDTSISLYFESTGEGLNYNVMDNTYDAYSPEGETKIELSTRFMNALQVKWTLSHHFSNLHETFTKSLCL